MRTVLVAACLASGCVSVSITEINRPPHPLSKRLSADVEVFTSNAPARSHVDVAVITADGDASLDKFIATLREKAAAIGCDAISIQPVVQQAHLAGTCIVYSDLPPSMARE